MDFRRTGVAAAWFQALVGMRAYLSTGLLGVFLHVCAAGRVVCNF